MQRPDLFLPILYSTWVFKFEQVANFSLLLLRVCVGCSSEFSFSTTQLFLTLSTVPFRKRSPHTPGRHSALPTIMAPSPLEMSFLLDPLVSESLIHNTRVCLLPRKPSSRRSKLTRTDPLQHPFHLGSPTRDRGRHSGAGVAARLWLLSRLQHVHFGLVLFPACGRDPTKILCRHQRHERTQHRRQRVQRRYRRMARNLVRRRTLHRGPERVRAGLGRRGRRDTMRRTDLLRIYTVQSRTRIEGYSEAFLLDTSESRDPTSSRRFLCHIPTASGNDLSALPWLCLPSLSRPTQ